MWAAPLCAAGASRMLTSCDTSCPVAEQMAAETIVIRLELQLADSSFTGRASTSSAPAREFSGWIGLLAAIDGLIAIPGPVHNQR
jgi:hypothetical protein